MTELSQLIDWFDNKKSVLVALSGGVDSALVAYAAFQKLGKSAIAVTADYKTLAQEELESAKKIANEIGIKHLIIHYDELENEDFVVNDKNRCYHCRTELAFHLKKIAQENRIDVIVDGTNLDDLGEYRPGITALQENEIKSPLLETDFSKKEIRNRAKLVGLSIYDRPSNSCLASRIPWGQKVTAEKLARIELGERIIKQISNVTQVRVRDFSGIAKIEVPLNEIELISDSHKQKDIESKLRLIGFSSVTVDQQGYRPGKINVIVD